MCLLCILFDQHAGREITFLKALHNDQILLEAMADGDKARRRLRAVDLEHAPDSSRHRIAAHGR